MTFSTKTFSWLQFWCLFLAIALLSSCQSQPSPSIPPFTENFIGADFPNNSAESESSHILSDGSSAFTAITQDSNINSGIPRLSILRIGTDGLINPSFSSDKFISVQNGFVMDFAEQSTGHVVVSAGLESPSYGNQYILRFNPDGTPETNFGINGKLVLSGMIVFPFTRVNIVVLPDDHLLVTSMSSTSSDLIMARLSATGVPDNTFGVNSRVTIKIPAPLYTGTYATSVISLADGSIMVAGYIADSTGYSRPMIVKLTSNGQLDMTFSDDGMMTTELGGENGIASQIIAIPGGDFIVTGNVLLDPQSLQGYSFLQRISSTGQARADFGVNGLYTTTEHDYTNFPRIVANAERLAMVYRVGIVLKYKLKLLTFLGQVEKEGKIGTDGSFNYFFVNPQRIDGNTVVTTTMRIASTSNAVQAGTLRLTPQ
jgi:uncharacterized delta-60 repeat protein